VLHKLYMRVYMQVTQKPVLKAVYFGFESSRTQP
jgi:hypothetical protein